MAHEKRRIPRKRIVLVLSFAVLILIIGGAAIWLCDFYPADDSVGTYLTEAKDVSVTEIDNGLLLDGSGSCNALIFYPGAKVEYTAYVPLMMKLAQNGVDVFLVRMPCNLAVLGKNKAESIINSYCYEHWYLGGHSLGGAMASDYVADCLKNGKKSPDGLILLAAYPNKSLANAAIGVLTIYGSEDKVLNRKKLQSGWSLLPASAQEIIIEGGNHAQFGCYGAQKGDGVPLISQEKQWEQTVSCVLRWIGAS